MVFSTVFWVSLQIVDDVQAICLSTFQGIRRLGVRFTMQDFREAVVMYTRSEKKHIEDELRGKWKITPLKTNMSPEERWLEDYLAFEMVPFQVTC